MKTFYPRQHPGNARVFTALLITFVLLMTPVVPFAAANARGAGYVKSSPLSLATYAPAMTVVSATKTDSFPDPDNDGKAEPGQTITYDVNVSNTGAADATGVNFSDTIDPNTTLVSGSLRVSPLAFADSYNATKDTALSISAPGVLSNDTGTPGPTAQPIAAGPTTQGGSVTLNADGSFSYTPPSGFEGADTFTYTATNGLSPNDSATVTINVDAGPAVTTTSPTNGASSVAQNSNITINFTEPVNATTGSFSIQCPTGSPQTFTIVNASPSASFTLDPTADLPAGTTCSVTVFAAGITDADSFDPPDNMAADYTFSFGVKPLAVDDMHAVTGNVRIDSSVSNYSVLANDQAPGATISAFDATSVHGGEVTMNTGTGTFTYDPPRGFTGTDSFNYTLSNGGGSDTGTVVLTVTDMVWFINNAPGACSSGCDGRLSHPFTSLASFEAINGNGTTVLGAVVDPEAGDNIFLYGLDGNYTGPLTLENNQRVIGQGATSSIATLTGITLAPDSDALPSTGGTNPTITNPSDGGIILAQNDSIHGLSVVNTSGIGISGNNFGTLTVSENVVLSNTTTGGTPISLNNGTCAATFKSISAGNNTADPDPANGIVLTNTTGSFVVDGDGTNTSVGGNASGGTIQRTVGADGATAGNGVYLSNASGVRLRRMQLNDHPNHAIRGIGSSDFRLEYSTVNGTNGTNASLDEGSVIFDALTGTNSFKNDSISGSIEDNLRVRNSSGTSDVFVNGCTFTNAPNDNLVVEPSGTAVFGAYVTGNTFTGAGGDHFQSIATGSAVLNLVFNGNLYSNGFPGSLLGGITISGGSTGSTETVNFDVSNNGTAANPLVGNVQGGAINVNKGLGNGNWQGRVSNNFIGNAGVANSGSSQSSAIRVESHSPTGTLTALIDGNTIRQWNNGPAINTQVGDVGNINAALNVTATNNNIANPGPSSQHGFQGNYGANAAGTNAVCSDVKTNTINLGAVPPNAGAAIRMRQRNGSTVRLPGYAGANTDTTAVGVFLNGQNTLTPSGSVSTAVASPPGGGYVGGAACTQPTVPTAPVLLGMLDDNSSNALTADAGRVAPYFQRSNVSDAVQVASLGDAAKYAVKQGKPHTSAFGSNANNTTEKTVKTSKVAARAATLAQPFSGETVNANIGTLAAGKTVHVQFQVTVDDPFPSNLSQVANQGTISGDNFSTVVTDDPAAGGSNDPTVTPILTPPSISIKDASVAEPASGSAPAAFAVTLSHSYTHTVTVDYATAPDTGGANPATAGSDYTTTGGTLTFNPGETVQTVSVPVLADGDNSETDETFLVNLSNNSANSSIADSQAVGTITPTSTAGAVLISELRTSGPAGADDEFVEILNNTDSPVTVTASDASGGWAIVKSGSGCGATPVVVAVIPNGTVIPARGNYLVTGSAYSLGAYAAGDQALILGIEDDRNVALFNTADLSNISTGTRLDAVGFGSNVGGNCDLLREGTTLADAQGSTSEYSFVRKVDRGDTQDTNNNAADFVVVSTTPASAVGANATPTLGAPGPENSTGARGPVPCNVPETAKFGRSRLDSTVALGSSPNTVRNATVGANAANGTIDFRRRFTNNTGGAVTQLRFRITNTNSSSPGAADLRALSSSPIVVAGVNDPATCGGPGPCSVSVVGTTLEQPPTQTSGGGVNSTLGVGTITLGTPLASGASVNLHLLFGVQQTGNYHLSIVIETATAGSIGQDEWELRGNTEDGGASASEGGCNTPPVANAGADQTIECGGGSTAVTLDGSASSDPDGDTLTYEWREGATVLGTTAVLNTSLAFGPHTITLKVTDPSGEFSEDTVSINIVDTTDPMITAPPNVTVNTGPSATSCGAFVSDATLGTATASDGCSASVTITRTGVPSGNNFPVGTTLVTYTADDGHGHTKSAQQVVTVIDNTPPTLNVPANIVVNAPANSCSANVDPGTATAGDNCPGVTVTGTRSDSQPLNAPYPVGTTTITWKATDASNNMTTGTQTVTVKDATPPTIVLTTNAISLGSPNHQYVTLTMSQLVASASDGCDPSVDINDVVVSQATSDEAEDAAGGGDGNTLNDIVIAPDCKSLQLRAERQGSGDGRVYKITLKVKDSSGNVATAVRTIVVPQSGPVVDSGVQYTVNGCTP